LTGQDKKRKKKKKRTDGQANILEKKIREKKEIFLLLFPSTILTTTLAKTPTFNYCSTNGLKGGCRGNGGLQRGSQMFSWANVLLGGILFGGLHPRKDCEMWRAAWCPLSRQRKKFSANNDQQTLWADQTKAHFLVGWHRGWNTRALKIAKKNCGKIDTFIMGIKKLQLTGLFKKKFECVSTTPKLLMTTQEYLGVPNLVNPKHTIV
jgi:hypothetical protein